MYNRYSNISVVLIIKGAPYTYGAQKRKLLIVYAHVIILKITCISGALHMNL